MQKNYFLFLFLILVQYCSSQNQGNIWYFGHYAGLSFNNGVATSINGGQLNSNEGAASICNKNGQLLFYTDGEKIWNRNHEIMTNGTGLYGNTSTTQSAIIVPKPDDPLRYFVFTVAAEGFPHGFCYSIVNMSLNGGLGDVEVKNIQLITPVCEKVTAISHCNGRDIWVITHGGNSDAYYAYLITSSGISPTPIVTNVGRVITDSLGETEGYMKASPDGSRLALAHMFLGVDLVNFDNTNGRVSNPIEINDINFVYGVEFSPNSALLYVSGIDQAGSTSELHQYGVNFSSPAQVLASKQIISQTHDILHPYYEALQLAPDGKIYMAQSGSKLYRSYLSVINDPNALGSACNFVLSAIDLSPNYSTLGLPNFMQSFLQKEDFKVSGSCQGQQLSFNYSQLDNLNSLQWDFGDPSSGPENTSTSPNASHYYAQSGVYTVKLVTFNKCGSDTIIKQIQVGSFDFSLGNDTTICGNAAYILKPNITGSFSYLWQDSSIAPSFNATTSGLYWLEVKDNQTGCIKRDSINLRFQTDPHFSLGPDRLLCQGQSIQLSSGLKDTLGVSFLWSNNSIDTSIKINSPGIYSLQLRNSCGTAVDSIKISEGVCKVYIPNAFTPNGDGLNDIFRARFGDNITSFRMEIYNRWGEKVFETNDINKGWDGYYKGQLQPEGNFAWIIKYNTFDNPQQQILKGTVLLIR